MFRIIRHEIEETGEYDCFLTNDGLWGTREEAREYDDADDAYERMRFEEDYSPYRDMGDWSYRVESDDD